MNLDVLHTLIARYEENLPTTMNNIHREQLKWEAVQAFRDVWFAPHAMDRPFAELFKDARKGCGVLLDNSRMNITAGVVKMA